MVVNDHVKKKEYNLAKVWSIFFFIRNFKMINIITKSDNIYKFDIICKSLYLIKNIKQEKNNS